MHRQALPIKAYTTTQTPLEFLTINARPLLYELVGRTAREGLEQGTALWAPEPPEGVYDLDGQPLNVAKIVQGIDPGDDVAQRVHTPDPAVDAVIQIKLHTHPLGGSVGLSESDWRSVATTLLQYPPRAREIYGRNPTHRAFCVLGQRMGEEDTATIKYVRATPAADTLTVEESRERSQELFAQLDGNLGLVPDEEIIAPVSELLDVGMGKFDLPEPPANLHFRSAVPETVEDAAFGNAYARGDLLDVLSGADYN